MKASDFSQITELLRNVRQGNEQAESRLFSLVYDDMRKMAGRQMARERRQHTLQPTALVHEAYIQLARKQNVDWIDRAHFFGIAAVVMRRILVDHARSVKADKRGGRAKKIELDEQLVYCEQNSTDLLALDEALEKLKQFAPRQSRLIELHFFGGLTFEEAGAVLGVSAKTAKRDWRAARAWLDGEINGWSDDAGAMGEDQRTAGRGPGNRAGKS